MMGHHFHITEDKMMGLPCHDAVLSKGVFPQIKTQVAGKWSGQRASVPAVLHGQAQAPDEELGTLSHCRGLYETPSSRSHTTEDTDNHQARVNTSKHVYPGIQSFPESVFEGISADQDAIQVAIATEGNIKAARIKASFRSTQIIGHMSDDSVTQLVRGKESESSIRRG